MSLTMPGVSSFAIPTEPGFVGRVILAVAAGGMGVLMVVFGDFLLQWQPVPVGVPGRKALVYLVAALLLAGGGALLSRTHQRAGATLLAILFSTWALGLHGPRVVAAPGEIAMWLGLAEIGAIAAACWTLVGSARTNRICVFLFGGAALVFGASHFAYPGITASLIPGWIPAKLFWAYFTGVAHLAAGVAIMSGILARIAGRSLAVMFGIFIIALHLPRVIADPSSRIEWTMLAIATALLGAACVIASTLPKAMPGSWLRWRGAREVMGGEETQALHPLD